MSDELIIRGAIPDDAEQLINFYTRIADYDYVETDVNSLSVEIVQTNLAQVYDSLENNIVLAINDNQIIGFCNVDHGELGIVVDKDYWHLGVGSELMYDTLLWFSQESKLDRIWLEVYRSNEVAINLYKKFEFIVNKEKSETLIMHKKR